MRPLPNPTALRRRLVLDIHGIGHQPAWVEVDEDEYWCDRPQTFEGLLDRIPEVQAACGTRIELTFDDGNASDATVALPALVRRGLPASFFVCAGRINKPGYLDRAALRDLLAAGMQIGSHGWSHVDWRRVDDATLEIEVDGARREIEDAIGQGVRAVAIPFGSYDRRVLRRLGSFSTLYTSDGGFAREGSRMVPRTSYRKDWTDTTLAELAGARESLPARARRAVVLAIKRMR